jgi:hypothetical protein
VPYETPITIKQALQRVQSAEYVLPAIQREFVWGHERITRLFDSLMRKYPIGGFLLWKLEESTANGLDLYRFLDRYNEFNHRHNERLALAEPRALHAVLDGQQRLSALNIGLTGTFAYRLPRKWAHKAESYPERRLYLELCSQLDPLSEDELAADSFGEGVRYRFEFLEPSDVKPRNNATTHWYQVSDVMSLESVVEAIPLLNAAGLSQEALEPATKTLERLRQTVHTDGVIATHIEEDQSLDRVLDIFVRVNSAGMSLSASDLLLSIATARWKERDARESIHGLVDALNATGSGFAFTQDLVLKASLVLTDATDIRFKSSNINTLTMAKVEQEWDAIESALKLAAQTLAVFGFNQSTLTAHSVAIPLADYIHQRSLGHTWLTSSSSLSERRAIRRWVLRSLLKSGVWGSGLDTLITTLRRTIRDHASKGFPVDELEKAMAGRGKSLVFTAEEVDALTETPYGSRAFAVLAAMFPGFDGTKAFHVDHVFPRSYFTRTRLAKAKLAPEDIEDCIARRDGLPNLQLLEGSVNISKQTTMPVQWMVHQFDDASRQAYIAAHDLEGTPDDFSGFLEFYETRRVRIRRRIASELGVASESSNNAKESDDDPLGADSP